MSSKELNPKNVSVDAIEEHDIAPSTLDFTPAQKSFIDTLQFVPEEKRKVARVTRKINDGFDAASMNVVSSSATLGGKTRANTVNSLAQRQEMLLGIMNVVGPIYRLVSQNLLINSATLADHMSEIVKTAKDNHKTQPHLVEGIAELIKYSKKLHPGRGASTKSEGEGSNEKSAADKKDQPQK